MSGRSKRYRKRIPFLCLVVSLGACGGQTASSSDTSDEKGSPDEAENADCQEGEPECMVDEPAPPRLCQEGDVRDVEATCGINLQGQPRDVCEGGRWRLICDDPDECTNGEMAPSSEPCGLNDAGNYEQYCEDGRWTVTSICRDPDVCENGEVKLSDKYCGLNLRGRLEVLCEKGRWVASDSCSDPDECEDWENRPSDVPCGINQRGSVVEQCFEGEWTLSLLCSDPDVCVDGEVSRGGSDCSGDEEGLSPYAVCDEGTMSDVVCRDTFHTVWDTTRRTSAENLLVLPLVSTGRYDFYVDWGDGTSGRVTSFDSPEASHQYEFAGTYQVEIFGTIEGWDMTPIPAESLLDYETVLALPDSLRTNAAYMLEQVRRWGPLAFGDTNSQFAFTDMRIMARDSPDLSGTTSLRAAFLRSNIHTARLNTWDVSGITDMAFAFMDIDDTAIVDAWDTSSVTNMSGMFARIFSFNTDLSGWDVSNVTDMSHMFEYSGRFNSDISSWNTGNVESMRAMFFHTSDFDQPIGAWDTSSVTDFSSMFHQAPGFNQDISGWDISSAEDMTHFIRVTPMRSEQYDALLNSWVAQDVQEGVSFSTSMSYSAAGAVARATLTDVHGWTISDGGLAP